MNSAVERRPKAASLGGGEFWDAVFRRLTWRFAALSLLAGLCLWLICTTYWTPSYAQQVENWVAWLVTASLLTVSVALAILAADEAAERGAPRVATYVGALSIAAASGAVAQFLLLPALGLPIWGQGQRWEIAYTEPAFIFFQTMIFGGIALFTYVSLRSAMAAARARNAAELARVQAKRRTYESQLQAMQARVEPQFLFNTLSQVRALYDADPVVAGQMLDDLSTYLRAALPHLRESSSTLDKEVVLARAYLGIVRVRLGDRLSFSLAVPDELRNARIPPMLLLPLIDYALANVFAATDGGTHALTVTATSTGNRLRLCVEEICGRLAAGSAGSQLESVADRIDALYGDTGTFTIDPMQDRGMRMVLEIPHDVADSHHR